ncbi:hypothetical protein HDV00_006569 [Rhizophlyctis rosea]|nr:hypothetical protein HDV00_006569 [Rhizophlyctis rosea]
MSSAEHEENLDTTVAADDPTPAPADAGDAEPDADVGSNPPAEDTQQDAGAEPDADVSGDPPAEATQSDDGTGDNSGGVGDGEEPIVVDPTAPEPEMPPWDENDPWAGYDDFLRPRPLIADANPPIMFPVIECNSEMTMQETEQDDGPMSKDTRVDIVYKKTVKMDICLQNFLQCNAFGPDVIQWVYCGETPYVHILVARPLTLKEIRKLDQYVSAFVEPSADEYYIVDSKDNYAQYSRELSGTDEVPLAAMVQPRTTKENTTIMGVGLYLEYFREDGASDPCGVTVRIYDWSHGKDVATRHFDLPAPGTRANPGYKKVVMTGLGGKVNSAHEHVWRLFIILDDGLGMKRPPAALFSGGTYMIGRKVTPDEIVQMGDRFYLTADPQHRYLEDELTQATSVAAFDVFYMKAEENLETRWKSKDLGVKTYPTLFKINNDGKLSRYSGSRDALDLVENFAI